MKRTARFIFADLLFALLTVLAGTCTVNTVMAQCADTVAPVYAHSCSNEYFDSIIVSGAGVTSTVSVLGVTSCRGAYFNYYALQGSTAPAGSTVSLYIARPNMYDAYLSVYIDWNNDGIY